MKGLFQDSYRNACSVLGPGCALRNLRIDICAATKSLALCQCPCPHLTEVASISSPLSIPVQCSHKLARLTKAPTPRIPEPDPTPGAWGEWQVGEYLYQEHNMLLYAGFQIYISVSKCDCAWVECQLGEGTEGQDTQQWPLGRARRLGGAFFPLAPSVNCPVPLAVGAVHCHHCQLQIVSQTLQPLREATKLIVLRFKILGQKATRDECSSGSLSKSERA